MPATITGIDAEIYANAVRCVSNDDGVAVRFLSERFVLGVENPSAACYGNALGIISSISLSLSRSSSDDCFVACLSGANNNGGVRFGWWTPWGALGLLG